MTIWKLDPLGFSALSTNIDGLLESRLIADIPGTDTILAADPLTIAERKAVVQAQINTMEISQLLPRVSREGLLLTLETFGAMQGVTPAQLYAANIAYHKTKDFDNLIVALRAQMEAIV